MPLMDYFTLDVILVIGSRRKGVRTQWWEWGWGGGGGCGAEEREKGEAGERRIGKEKKNA